MGKTTLSWKNGVGGSCAPTPARARTTGLANRPHCVRVSQEPGSGESPRRGVHKATLPGARRRSRWLTGHHIPTTSRPWWGEPRLQGHNRGLEQSGAPQGHTGASLGPLRALARLSRCDTALCAALPGLLKVGGGGSPGKSAAPAPLPIKDPRSGKGSLPGGGVLDDP